MASTAHLVISELGDLLLQRGREGAPQRLLRHRAGPTHRLGGLTYAVDHVRPPSPPGWASTRGYLRDRKTCVQDGVNKQSPSRYPLTKPKDASWCLLVPQVAWMHGVAPGRLGKTSRVDHAYSSKKGIRFTAP